MSHYIHGTAPSEQDRLAALNRLNNPLFLEFLDLSGAHSILEVGCGMGLLTAEVARQAPTARVVGLEYSADQLAKAPAPGAPDTPANLSFVHGDAHALPFEDASFDIVYCRFVLEHVANPVNVLREMRRILTPGGRAFVMENNILACDFDPDCPRFGAIWHRFARLQAKLGGDALIGKRLYRLMRSAGFEDVRLSIQPEVHDAGQATFKPWVRNLIGNIRSADARLIEEGLAMREEVEAAVAELEALIHRDDATALFYWNRAIAVA